MTNALNFFFWFFYLFYWNSFWTGTRRINVYVHLHMQCVLSFLVKETTGDMTNDFSFLSLLFIILIAWHEGQILVHGSITVCVILCRMGSRSCANMVLKDWSQSVSGFMMHFSQLIVVHSVVTRKSVQDITYSCTYFLT